MTARSTKSKQLKDWTILRDKELRLLIKQGGQEVPLEIDQVIYGVDFRLD